MVAHHAHSRQGACLGLAGGAHKKKKKGTIAATFSMQVVDPCTTRRVDIVGRR